jgi:hypothetical protein
VINLEDKETIYGSLIFGLGLLFLYTIALNVKQCKDTLKEIHKLLATTTTND